MDNLNFVEGGTIKLPPGFRFLPTDEEIVFQYLTRKILSCPLPASIIPEINVFKYDPSDLPGDMEQDRYFFSNKQDNYRNENRATNCGYWKASGLDTEIKCSRRKSIMGMKRTLVFYKSKSPNGCFTRTDWIMHEYRLVNSVSSSCNLQHNPTQNSIIQLGSWVLCRISLKKRSTINNNENIKDERANMGDLGPTSSCSSVSSSSGSSIITEVSSSELNDEEASSCNGVSSYYYRGDP